MDLLIFDIDGTITNTKAIDDFCFITSIKKCWGCDLTSTDWNSYLNVTDSGLAREIFYNFFNKVITEKELSRLKDTFFRKIAASANEEPHSFFEIDGAKDFFNELKKQEMKVAIATGGWKITAAFKLDQIGLALDQFPHSTADDHDSRGNIIKTAIEKASKAYKQDFDKIIYIGDGVWDYKASRELNIEFIGIDNLANGKLLEEGAKTVYKDYLDKDAIIQAIMAFK